MSELKTDLIKKLKVTPITGPTNRIEVHRKGSFEDELKEIVEGRGFDDTKLRNMATAYAIKIAGETSTNEIEMYKKYSEIVDRLQAKLRRKHISPKSFMEELLTLVEDS